MAELRLPKGAEVPLFTPWSRTQPPIQHMPGAFSSRNWRQVVKAEHLTFILELTLQLQGALHPLSFTPT
jgi:hypothetical protein